MTSWKLLKRDYLEKNEWIALRKDSCETPTGQKLDAYYVLEIQDVSCTVAITKENKILFVKEYKHGVQKEILQLPCGYVNTGEKPLATAKRELEEETGYTSKRWRFLGKFAGSPGRLTHYYYLFLAEDCEKTSAQKLDKSETLSVVPYTKEEAEMELKKQDTDIITPLGFLCIFRSLQTFQQQATEK